MYGDPLTPLERDAIAVMLRHDHPVADALRHQLDACRVKHRERTGVGFYTDIVVPEARSVSGIGHLTLGDAVAEIDGLQHGVGFVLFIRDGMLDQLEGYSFDERWPEPVTTYAVHPVETLTPGDVRALRAAERRRQATLRQE